MPSSTRSALFTSTTIYPVITRGAGNEAAIIVYMLLPDGTAKGNR